MPASLLLGSLEQFDRSLLHWINCDLHAPWVRDVLFTLQRKEVGITLVVALAVVVSVARGRRTALRVLASCALAFLMGWGLAAGLWKTFERPRPPHQLDVVLRTPAEIATCASHPASVSVRKYVSRRPGMPSQHAQHSAAFAAVLFLALRWLGVGAAVYAFLVAWARVYAGVHWPTDVIVGLLIGPLVGWLAWRLVPTLFGWVGLRGLVHADTVDRADVDDPESTAGADAARG